MKRKIASFIAYNHLKKAQTFDIFREFRRVEAHDADDEVPMGAEIRTRTGRICHRLEKGVYRVSGTGEIFKSQEEPKIE